MRFTLIDRITLLEPGKRIEAIKNLTMAEEYLAEHFPGFPVLPGVLMLEAVSQAGAWLIRSTVGFDQTIILLKEAKTVKYGHFVTPGKQLKIVCEWAGEKDGGYAFKARGDLDGNTSISCRLVLDSFRLRDQHEGYLQQDRRLRIDQSRLFQRLCTPECRTKLRKVPSR
jgi:3-hydroxyacyl-[acyl-carrier-protein] dehydratase